MEDCLFCKIIKKEIPSDVVYEDEEILAFRDINPAAPVHILIIPKKHIESAKDLKKEDEELIGRMFTVINKLAQQEGISEKGYRIVTNSGKDSGQEVMHFHLHLIGGKELGSKICK